MPSRPDRLRVWNGEIKRTRGGLMRVDFVKNKSGKIVSRRRSAAAKVGSNLGKWLRVKGHKFRDVPEGAVKASKPAHKPKPAAPKPKKAEPKAKPKPSPALPKPKKTEPKKQARPKPVAAPPKRPAPKASSSLGKSKYGISGSVAQPRMSRKEREAKKHKISVANVISMPTKTKSAALTDEDRMLAELGLL